jgi:release factor glutamine methyltransferase
MTEIDEHPVYEPREDSYLLQKQVKKYAKGNCLDVGTGSGIQAITAAKKKTVSNVTAIDLNPKALAYAKINNSHEKIVYKKSNLFSSLKRDKFDTIIFNPPYLPNDPKIKDMALDGGEKGYELLETFISFVPEHLNEKGILLLLFSSMTDIQKVHEILDHNLLRYKELSNMKLDFEKLFVYRVRKSSTLIDLQKKNDVKSLQLFAKGKRGLVYSADYKGKQIVIKMLRNDTKAESAIKREIKNLKLFQKKKLDFVPKLLFHGKNYFAYDYIDGMRIDEFLPLAKKSDILKIILDVMEYMYRLDKLGYTKEEMHNPYKHILIEPKTKKSYLIDFERSKKSEKPKNVTQFSQYLISSNFHKLVKNKDLFFEPDVLVPLCRKYKSNKEEIYKEIQEYIKSKFK